MSTVGDVADPDDGIRAPDPATRRGDEVLDGDPGDGDARDAGGRDRGTGDRAGRKDGRDRDHDTSDHVDELPEDLDAAGYVGPYLFPDNNRRRIPGYLYLATAAACVVVWALVDSPYVNGGFLLAGGLLAAMGAYQIVSGWNLNVDERDALVAASRTVGFPVGHASAQLGWRGLLSRPTWRILLYSADTPPARRGLVLVDGVDGTVVEHFVEDNPEDWSQYQE
jgi:hypothetical protein